MLPYKLCLTRVKFLFCGHLYLNVSYIVVLGENNPPKSSGLNEENSYNFMLLKVKLGLESVEFCFVLNY